jgi:murein DD-endopeptidase MepM/ murein hydrolase activator NlpD
MANLNEIKDKLNEKVKYSASDPSNFEVKWSFIASRIQLWSLIVLLVLITGVLSAFFVLKGPLSFYFSKNDVSIERKKVEEQHRQILDLRKRIDAQEQYITSARMILSGEVIEDSLSTVVPEAAQVDPRELQSDLSTNEAELAEKVKDDLRTGSLKKKKEFVSYFSAPVKGVVSQSFDRKNHAAIDIVTVKNSSILACQAGTVVYSGYTQKDGFTLIIAHPNSYMSVYKHARNVFKKSGDRVQMNDPIGIVGTTGENSTGPHLHFELWYEQQPVDPQKYVQIER